MSTDDKKSDQKTTELAPSAASYRGAGVDVSAADDWVSLIQRSGEGLDPTLREKIRSGVGDYAAVYALNDDEWVATSCDGVGTKLLWTIAGRGDPRHLAQDLLAMNANDLLCVGATPRLFLDYIAVGSKALMREGGVLNHFIDGLVAACRSTGQLLVGGETAQMPDLYGEKGFDLAGFSVGFLKPHEFLSVEGIRPGAELWGWPSQGPHANGFSWLRKIFARDDDAEFITRELMRPTRLYVNEFRALRAALGPIGPAHAGAPPARSGPVQAAFHITGSGYLNLLRAQPGGRTVGFDLDGWGEAQWPRWVQHVAERSAASKRELYTTFNMGIGFAVVLPAELGEKHGALLGSSGLIRLGRVIEEPVVLIDGQRLE